MSSNLNRVGRMKLVTVARLAAKTWPISLSCTTSIGESDAYPSTWTNSAAPAACPTLQNGHEPDHRSTIGPRLPWRAGLVNTNTRGKRNDQQHFGMRLRSVYRVPLKVTRMPKESQPRLAPATKSRRGHSHLMDKTTTERIHEPQVREGGVDIPEHADIGLKYLVDFGIIQYTANEEKIVRQKIDRNLLPILSVSYCLRYLDKVTLSYAAVYGLREDVGLSGYQYSWVVALFYFGYLVASPAANYLIQKFPIAKYAAGNILIWGVLVMLCAAARNFAGIAALRFLVAVFEASIEPCWVHITGMFYKREEQGARVIVWYSMVGFGAVIGSLISYGVGHIQVVVKVWQFIFLICGGATILWSAIVLLYLPDSPANAKFLAPRERAIAIDRIRENRTGVKTTQFKWGQAREALIDPQCIIFALWNGISNILNINGSFLPLIIKGMGFSGLTTTLLTLPVGGIQIIAMILAAVLCSFFPKGRTVIMFAMGCPTLIGAVLLAHYPPTAWWIRCSGIWLFGCLNASYAVMLSLIASNVAGFSKKVTTTCMTFALGSVGNIVSPHLFLDQEAPVYPTALRSMLVAICLCQILTIMLGIYYQVQNRRRDKIFAQAQQDGQYLIVTDEEFLDRSDTEDSFRFRYRW